MTTKTRADLLAAKAAMPETPKHEWKVGDRVAMLGTVCQLDYGKYTGVKVDGDCSPESSVKAEFFYPTALIPAADLIPRAEHERLIAEVRSNAAAIRQICAKALGKNPEDQVGHSITAVVQDTVTKLKQVNAPALSVAWAAGANSGAAKINAESAVTHLVTEYAKDWDFKGSEFEPQTYTHVVGTVKYAVTVSRKADVPVAVPDAEPVGYANELVDGRWTGICNSKEVARDIGASIYGALEIAVPLYRHPAPATPKDAAPFDLFDAVYLMCNEGDLNGDCRFTREVNGVPITVSVTCGKTAHELDTPAQPVAVASQSVVDEIREASSIVAARAALRCTRNMIDDPDYISAKDAFHAALAKITTAEPDKFWLSRMAKSKETPCVLINNAVCQPIGVGISDIPGFCAALIARGNEMEAGK